MDADKMQVTQLLGELRAGRREALDPLLPQVYDELRRIAHNQLRKERVGHTLDTVGLVHEAYAKLVDYREQNWENRAHFYAVAAQAMRRILVTYARQRNRAKRGGGVDHVTLGVEDRLAAVTSGMDWSDEVAALDAALTDLEAINPRHARVVECRFFAGLTIEDTAEALGISPITVTRDWRMARAWLKDALG